MTAAEGNPDIKLSDALVKMLERLTDRIDALAANQDRNRKEIESQMQSMEHRLASRIDKLQTQVVGNGDDRAIIVRLRELERTMHDILAEQELGRKEREENRALAETNLKNQERWRNIAVGIGIAAPIVFALSAYILGQILGLALP